MLQINNIQNMSNPSDNIRTIRRDLSPYLFNFLRDDDAPTILHEILTSGILLSKEHEYICFTDAPITCYLSNLEYFNSWKERGYKAMFSQYGIGIARDWLVENVGARPVIYGKADEINFLNESIRWRFQELDIQKGDFSWLREWRIPMKELNLYEIPRDHIIFIAPKEEELREYAVDWDFDVDFDYDHGETHPYLIETPKETRFWKGFSIDQIKEIENDFVLSACTKTQIIGEKLL